MRAGRAFAGIAAWRARICGLAARNPPGEEMTRTAFVGLGNMGGAMAANVLRAGIPLTLYDPHTTRMAALRELGGVEAGSLDELAGADVVITMIPNDAALSAVALGE